jgi:hypothetical protein
MIGSIQSELNEINNVPFPQSVTASPDCRRIGDGIITLRGKALLFNAPETQKELFGSKAYLATAPLAKLGASYANSQLTVFFVGVSRLDFVQQEGTFTGGLISGMVRGYDRGDRSGGLKSRTLIKNLMK